MTKDRNVIDLDEENKRTCAYWGTDKKIDKIDNFTLFIPDDDGVKVLVSKQSNVETLLCFHTLALILLQEGKENGITKEFLIEMLEDNL